MQKDEEHNIKSKFKNVEWRMRWWEFELNGKEFLEVLKEQE